MQNRETDASVYQERLAEMYVSQHTLEEMAKEFDVSPDEIERRLRALDAKQRLPKGYGR